MKITRLLSGSLLVATIFVGRLSSSLAGNQHAHRHSDGEVGGAHHH
jgi:hypothetical protein